MRAAFVGLFAAMPLACMAAGDWLPPPLDAAAEYQRRVAAPEAMRCTAVETVVLPVEPGQGASFDTTFDATTGRLRILYRMSFNQITEGWNWRPLQAAEGGDYYVFKYLPLGSTREERGSYHAEDKTGVPQEFSVRWRYDYFFAFDNPYEFYPRGTDDDAGLAAEITVPAAEAERLAHGDLRMAMRGRLGGECLSESTTFWKATYSKPVDFTLKKRYLIGKLVEVYFYDAASGRLLARIAGSGERPPDTNPVQPR